jgi:hypothetical protein
MVNDDARDPRVERHRPDGDHRQSSHIKSAHISVQYSNRGATAMEAGVLGAR